MVNSTPFWKRSRRTIWTLLFLLLATVSMVGPTHAVRGIVTGAVTVTETFALLVGDETAPPAGTSTPSERPGWVDSALALDFGQLTDVVPWLAADDTELLTVGEPGAAAASQNAGGSQSGRQASSGIANGGGGGSGGSGGSAPRGSGGSGGGGGATAPGVGGAPSEEVFGRDEALSELTQELGVPDLESETGLSVARQSGGNGLTNTGTDQGPAPGGAPGSDAPLGGLPGEDAATDSGPVLEDVAAGLPPGLWPPDLPRSEGAPPNNGALSPPAIAKLLDPEDPGLPAIDEDSSSPNDESPVARLASTVAQVPEPATLMMLSLGVLALSRRRNTGGPRK